MIGIDLLKPSPRAWAVVVSVWVVGLAALLLVVVGTLIASAAPDGIQRLTGQATDSTAWSQRAIGGTAGLALILVLCYLGGKLISRRRSA